ncbi:MAG: ABC transporter ATP-binding protein [Pseudomonadota bacterium]
MKGSKVTAGSVLTSLRSGLAILRAYPRKAAVLGLLICSGVAVGAAIPQISRFVINALRARNTFSPLWFVGFALVFFGLRCTSRATEFFRSLLALRLEDFEIRNLRKLLYHSLLQSSAATRGIFRYGALADRISSDPSAASGAVVTPLVELSFIFLTLFASLSFGAFIDLRLCLTGFVGSIAAIPLVLWRSSKHQEEVARWKEVESDYSAFLVESLTGARDIQQLDLRSEREAKNAQFVSRLEQASWSKATRVDSLEELMYLEFVILEGIIFAWGWVRVSRGLLPLGDLFAIGGYFEAMFYPMFYLTKRLSSLHRATVSLRRIDSTVAKLVEPGSEEARERSGFPDRTNTLTVRRLFFSYPNSLGEPKIVLSGVDFHVREGERVALVGPNGQGKTTVINLLTGQYRPDQGEIWVRGREMGKLSLFDRKNEFGIASQDPHLFFGTVRFNLGLADHPRSNDILRLFQSLGIDEIFGRLPHGIDTVIDPSQRKISGGELRTIAFARSLVNGAPILLLDEPTLGLDIDNHERVVSAIRKASIGKTLFCVTHDPALIAICDRILELDGGMVTEITSQEIGSKGRKEHANYA